MIEQIIAAGGRLAVLGQGNPNWRRDQPVGSAYPAACGFHAAAFNEADASGCLPQRLPADALALRTLRAQQSSHNAFGSLPIGASASGGWPIPLKDDQTGFCSTR